MPRYLNAPLLLSSSSAESSSGWLVWAGVLSESCSPVAALYPIAPRRAMVTARPTH